MTNHPAMHPAICKSMKNDALYSKERRTCDSRNSAASTSDCIFGSLSMNRLDFVVEVHSGRH